MFNVKTYDYDCTRKCRLPKHGNDIILALTKRSISDEKLAAYIAKTCCNFCDIVDYLGRSAVHMSASVARYVVLEWLLNNGAIINGREYESGSSPLHRAIFYGAIDCAVLLLRYGASLDLLDEDTRCPLQSVCRMPDYRSAESLNDILVWGLNKNYNLGIGNEQSTNAPQAVDFFRKSNISIESLALGAYHSLFLDKKNNLYAVGHGKGGRLGIANESSLPTPKKIKVPVKQEKIICISVSRKHSLVLSENSLVFACGVNDERQLGVRDADNGLATFKEVVSLRDQGATGLRRVIARDTHSIAYGERSIYVWGSNHGQFGINPNTKTLNVPTLLRLPSRTSIAYVEANNAATVIYSHDNVIYLYYNDKLRSIKPPNYEALKSIAIVGGDNVRASKGTVTALKLLLLTVTNVAFFWYEKTQHFYRCSLAQIRVPEIDKLLYKSNQVLILSQGCVYRGKCNQVLLPVYTKANVKTSIDLWQDNDNNRTEISNEHMIRIDLQRVPHIDRAVDIFCDDDFASFAVLQESHMKYFKPPQLSATEYNFKKLYHEASETDAVHDLIFNVDGEKFAAHKLIIYARAPGLSELIKPYLDKQIYLNLKGLTGKMFEIILKYIYTNSLPTMDDIDCIRQSLGPDAPADNSEVCDLFHEFLVKFQLKNLAAYVSSYLGSRVIPLQASNVGNLRFNRIHRQDFPELYDVRIICEDQTILQAHKCMLVARLEYFDMMFMHTWAEHSTINLSTIPAEYMQPILDFLYSSDIQYFRKQNYSETFLYNMIVFCDQFFIERLQAVCELLILEKISIRKCGEMFDFACMYNCKLLKEGCMDFICQNLARVLAYRSLEQCEPEALKCLNQHYRAIFDEIFSYRHITPESEALSDELLLSFVDDFSVDLDYRMDEKTELKSAKQKQKELKNKQDVRQYEREAITSMMRTLRVSESEKTATHADITQVTEEVKKVNAELQNEAKNWLKVVDKKEQKRKSAEIAVKTHIALKEDELPPLELVPVLPVRRTSERETPTTPPTPTATPETTNTPSKAYELDFGMLTPQQTQKLSQKQRKRLTSESKSTTSTLNWRSPVVQPTTSTSTTPIAVPNAWGVLPPQTPTPTTTLSGDDYAASYTLPTAATGSANDATSFANMMRGNTTPPTNNFTQILADERRQREQYERMRNKSLVLTQIEETAIAELREFYNADNVDDELITIERKLRPSTMNFSSWQRY